MEVDEKFNFKIEQYWDINKFLVRIKSLKTNKITSHKHPIFYMKNLKNN